MSDQSNPKPDTPHILVVDDNAQARLLIRRIFEREGFTVDEAGDGPTAVRKALETPTPDLILLDVQMPIMSGFEVLEQIRGDKRSERIPIIVVTAAARDPKDIMHGFGIGADDYMVKPFNAVEMVARARSKIRAFRLEEDLIQRTHQLELLLSLGEAMNRAFTFDNLAESLLDAALSAIPSDGGVVILGEADQPEIQVWARGFGVGAQIEHNGETRPRTESITNLRTCLLIENTGERPDVPLEDIFPLQLPPQSALAAPLIYQGRSLGLISLGSMRKGAFDNNHLRVLRTIAEQAALAVQNVLLFTRLQNYAQTLELNVAARTSQLQAAQAELMRSEKLASLGMMASVVAHEINNPLQLLMSNLEMTLEDIESSRPVDKELVEQAKNEVERIKQIIRQLLDFARPARSELAPVDINEVTQDVLSLAGRKLSHSRIMVEEVLEARSLVHGNADQIKQVLLNLLLNAVDAMPEGGTIRLATQDIPPEVQIIVWDTGSGIKPEQITQVFEPFHTTKTKGTGLGLAISQKIIESHGGKISVESKPGSGARFVIGLPALKNTQD